MNNKEKITNFETMNHIRNVQKLLMICITDLNKRLIDHDKTKMDTPELEIFTEYTDKLKTSTYGSDEYKRYLDEMKIALDHHYKHNRHHPDYFINGINDMTLVDLLEMICDWKAATLRHNNGDIDRSIELNKERFNISEQLAQILSNTVKYYFK